MNWIKSLTIILLSSMATLILAEIAFRFLEVGYGNAPLNRSNIYHHSHPTNYTFTMYDPNAEFGGHMVHYDELGFRTQNNLINEQRDLLSSKGILFLGDSFTEANQVDYEQTFVSLVANKLNIQTYNLGVSSYSPIIYRMQALNILPMRPEAHVVVQLFSNDFFDDRKYEKAARYRDGIIIAIDGGNQNWLHTILRKSYVARVIRKGQIIIANSMKQETPLAQQLKYRDQLFQIEQDVSDGDIKNSVMILKDIQNILSEQGKSLAVILIPSKFLSRKNICCSNDKFYRRVSEEITKNDITFIDISEAFNEFPDQPSLFFEKDIHLTEKGHQLIADEISKHFQSVSNTH